jgi:hypothetical protein
LGEAVSLWLMSLASLFRSSVLSTSLLLLGLQSQAQQPIKVLFDAAHGQTAGNADWVIDQDNSGPQRVPTPLQSTVTATTAETYWNGALSSWGIALVKRGYQVETLPSSGRLTYGDASNAQDLKNYPVFIVDEPNTKFTTAEKTALLAYVRNGGGLFMISDHNISDRNGDGWDSPHIWNDWLSTTTGASALGITFDYNNLVINTSNVPTIAQDSLLHGPAGDVSRMEYHNGATLTLDRTVNPSLRGVIFNPGASNTGTTGVFVAYGRLGKGRVVALGDSSPPDDGTGASGNSLYDGWAAEAGGDHARVLINATIWLATPNRTGLATRSASGAALSVYPNPADNLLTITAAQNMRAAELLTVLGQPIAAGITARSGKTWEVNVVTVPTGFYQLRITLADGTMITQRIARR